MAPLVEGNLDDRRRRARHRLLHEHQPPLDPGRENERQLLGQHHPQPLERGRIDNCLQIRLHRRHLALPLAAHRVSAPLRRSGLQRLDAAITDAANPQRHAAPAQPSIGRVEIATLEELCGLGRQRVGAGRQPLEQVVEPPWFDQQLELDLVIARRRKQGLPPKTSWVAERSGSESTHPAPFETLPLSSLAPTETCNLPSTVSIEEGQPPPSVTVHE